MLTSDKPYSFLTTLKGNAIRLEYTPPSGGKYKWIVPYTEEMGLSVNQTYIQPIQKFFGIIQETASAVTSNLSSLGGAVITSAIAMQDLFGKKLFQRGYYASAWTGSQPASINITLNFFRGISGEWNALEEVFNPIGELMKVTVPIDKVLGFDIMTSPGPTPASVFVTYGSDIVKGALTELRNVGSADNKSTLPASEIDKNIEKTKTFNGTWDLQYGYFNGKIFTKYIQFNKLIIDTSSCTFSSQVEKQEKMAMTHVLPYIYTQDKYYPISGKITLSMKTQEILVSGDFVQEWG